MKTFPSRSGFTLVELLTVIAIIAVLMGILFPTIGAAIEAAKKTQAKTDCLQIVNAVKAYYTEYGKYPDVANGSVESGANNTALMNILRGKDDAKNPRKIIFLEVNDAKKAGKGGIQPSTGQWFDPWGYPYKVKFDAEAGTEGYDNQVSNPYSSNAGSAKLDTGVIAWSIGRDGQGGSGNKTAGTSKDDVISWQ